MEEALTFYDQWNHRISAIISVPDGPAGAAVVLCHGFLSNKNSTTNRTLTRMLNERGLATFRFDFFGQGDSEGLLEDITVSLAVDQAMAAADCLAGKGYRRIGLAGSSFGGLVGILTVARRDDVASLALKCPVVDFAEELRLEFGTDELTRWKETDTIPSITGGSDRIRMKYRLYEDSLEQVAYEPAANIFVPTLIVQGERDELVPLHQSTRLLQSLGGIKRLDLLPGADHRFTNGEDFRTMTTSITTWFTTYLLEKPAL